LHLQIDLPLIPSTYCLPSWTTSCSNELLYLRIIPALEPKVQS